MGSVNLRLGLERKRILMPVLALAAIAAFAGCGTETRSPLRRAGRLDDSKLSQQMTQASQISYDRSLLYFALGEYDLSEKSLALAKQALVQKKNTVVAKSNKKTKSTDDKNKNDQEKDQESDQKISKDQDSKINPGPALYEAPAPARFELTRAVYKLMASVLSARSMASDKLDQLAKVQIEIERLINGEGAQVQGGRVWDQLQLKTTPEQILELIKKNVDVDRESEGTVKDLVEACVSNGNYAERSKQLSSQNGNFYCLSSEQVQISQRDQTQALQMLVTAKTWLALLKSVDKIDVAKFATMYSKGAVLSDKDLEKNPTAAIILNFDPVKKDNAEVAINEYIESSLQLISKTIALELGHKICALIPPANAMGFVASWSNDKAKSKETVSVKVAPKQEGAPAVKTAFLVPNAQGVEPMKNTAQPQSVGKASKTKQNTQKPKKQSQKKPDTKKPEIQPPKPEQLNPQKPDPQPDPKQPTPEKPGAQPVVKSDFAKSSGLVIVLNYIAKHGADAKGQFVLNEQSFARILLELPKWYQLHATEFFQPVK